MSLSRVHLAQASPLPLRTGASGCSSSPCGTCVLKFCSLSNSCEGESLLLSAKVQGVDWNTTTFDRGPFRKAQTATTGLFLEGCREARPGETGSPPPSLGLGFYSHSHRQPSFGEAETPSLPLSCSGLPCFPEPAHPSLSSRACQALGSVTPYTAISHGPLLVM